MPADVSQLPTAPSRRVSLSAFIARHPKCIDSTLQRLSCVDTGISHIDINTSLLSLLVNSRNGAPMSVRREAATVESADTQEKVEPSRLDNDNVTEEAREMSAAVGHAGVNIALAFSFHTVLLPQNRLTRILGVIQFKHVVRLSLMGNRIARIDALEPLALLSSLQYLSLEFNPVTELPHYRAHVIRMCCWPEAVQYTSCRLRKLDGTTITEREVRHSELCLLREVGLIGDLLQRVCLAELLTNAWNKLELHRELRLRGMLLSESSAPLTVNSLVAMCATRTAIQAHQWKEEASDSTQLWGSTGVPQDTHPSLSTGVLEASAFLDAVHAARKLVSSLRPARSSEGFVRQTTSPLPVGSASVQSLRTDEQDEVVLSPVRPASTGGFSTSESDHPVRVPEKARSTTNTPQNGDADETLNTANVYDFSGDERETSSRCSGGTAGIQYIGAGDVSNHSMAQSALSAIRGASILSSTRKALGFTQTAQLTDDWTEAAHQLALSRLDARIRSTLVRLAERLEHSTLTDVDVDGVLRLWLQCLFVKSQMYPGQCAHGGQRTALAVSSQAQFYDTDEEQTQHDVSAELERLRSERVELYRTQAADRTLKERFTHWKRRAHSRRDTRLIEQFRVRRLETALRTTSVRGADGGSVHTILTLTHPRDRKSLLLRLWKQSASERQTARHFRERFCIVRWRLRTKASRMAAQADQKLREHVLRGSLKVWLHRYADQSATTHDHRPADEHSATGDSSSLKSGAVGIATRLRTNTSNQPSGSLTERRKKAVSTELNGLSQPRTSVSHGSKSRAGTASSPSTGPRVVFHKKKKTVPNPSASPETVESNASHCILTPQNGEVLSPAPQLHSSDDASSPNAYVDANRAAEHAGVDAGSVCEPTLTQTSSTVPTPVPPQFSSISADPGVCEQPPARGAHTDGNLAALSEKISELHRERRSLVDAVVDAERRAQQSKVELNVCKVEMVRLRNTIAAMSIREECAQATLMDYRAEIQRQRAMIDALRAERRAAIE